MRPIRVMTLLLLVAAGAQAEQLSLAPAEEFAGGQVWRGVKTRSHTRPSELQLFYPGSYDQPFIAEVGDVRVVLRAVRSRAAGVRENGGNLVYEQVFEATDAIARPGREQFETTLFLRDERAPRVFEYEIVERRGIQSIEERDGAIVFAPASPGRAPGLQINRPANGHWSIVKEDSGSRGIRLIVDAASTYPVSIDTSISLTGNLTRPRFQHSARLLPDQRVLFTGGRNDADSVAAAELFDPATGLFLPVHDSRPAHSEPEEPFLMPGRQHHTATLLRDGRVLIVGGTGRDNTHLASAELFDPSTGTFAPTGDLANAREHHTATLLANGRVLIAGGRDAVGALASAELYDPMTGSFTLVIAAIRSWTGAASSLWSEPNNWSPVGVPSAGDSLVFPSGAANLTNTNDLTAGTAFNSIVFNGNLYTIGGNSIALTSGIQFNGSNITIDVNIRLDAAQSFSGGGSIHHVTFGGDIDLQSHVLTVIQFSPASFNGVISGTGGLNFPHNNTHLTLSGNNIYTGGTTNNSFLLVVGNQPSSNITNTISLTGSGTVGAVSGNGSVNPGTSLEIPNGIAIFRTGSLTLAGQATIEINGAAPGTGYDQIEATGTVTLSPGATLNTTLAGSVVPTTGQVFTIINNDGTDAVSGTFSGLPQGATITLNSVYVFTISYAGGTGNDTTLTCTTAPKTWTGAVNAQWSNGANWSGGAPTSGDTLVFPAGASNLINNNDLPAGTVFHSINFNGNGYTIGGNSIGLSNGIQLNASNNTVNLNIQLTASQTFSGVSGGVGGPTMQLTVGGNIDLQSHTLTVTLFARATFTGVISGTGGLNFPHNNTHLTLSGNNTYTGGTTNNSFLLVLGNQPSSNITNTVFLTGSGTVGTVSGNGYVNPGTSHENPNGIAIFRTGSLTLSGQATIEINGAAPGTGYDQIDVTGTVTLSSEATLAATMAGSVVPTLGQVFTIINNDGGDAVSGTFSGLPQGATITFNSVYVFTISYSGGTGNDVTLTCTSAPKTWSGAVNAQWSNPGNWSGGAPASGDKLVFPAGASNLVNNNDLPPGTVFHSIIFNGGNYEIGGNDIGLSNGIQSAGTINIISLNMQLTAAQTFSGTLSVFGDTVTPLTLGGNIDLQSHTLTVTLFSNATFTGVISGTGGLNFPHNNTHLTLSGNNTYTGGTTNNSFLLVLGNQPSSNITNTVFLTGSGTVGTVSGNGYVNPGTSHEIPNGIAIFRTGSLTLAGQATIEINGAAAGSGYDQIDVTGTVQLISGAALTATLGFTPTAGQVFTIIRNDGVDPVSGTFAGRPQGSVITLNTVNHFQINYAGGDGNDVVMTALSGRETSTAVTSSLNPSNPGQSVTFTATVTALIGGTPIGMVTFKDGSSTLGTSSLAGGQATYTTSALAEGSHSITVEYGGDASFDASSSPTLVQIVNSAPSITAGAPLGRSQGSTGGATIATVSDANDAAGTLTVTATVVPDGISITNIVNSNGTVTATVTASCASATGANNVTLQVQDSGGLTATATFIVNVTVNTPPALGDYSNSVVVATGSIEVTPTVAPADNGTVTLAVSASAAFTGTVSVNSSTGVVSIGNSTPGTHTITVTATDNCDVMAAKSFRLDVAITAPTELVATATSGTTVALTWNAVAGAHHYEVVRNSGSGYSVISIPATNGYTDTVTVHTAHVYRVRAVASGGEASSLSNVDIATTTMFADDPLVPGTTPIRAIHLMDLRTAANAVRAAAGLPAATFTGTDPTGLAVLAVHITEVRSALDTARSALGLVSINYTNAPLNAMPVRALDFTELRNGVK